MSEKMYIEKFKARMIGLNRNSVFGFLIDFVLIEILKLAGNHI